LILLSVDLAEGGVIIDPDSGTSTPIAADGRPSSVGTRIVVGDNLVIGPSLDRAGGVLSPKTNKWAPMADPPASAAAIDLNGTAVEGHGLAIFWGGLNADGAKAVPVADGLTYDPASDAWLPTAGPGEPAPRLDVPRVVIGSKFYLVGGRLNFEEHQLPELNAFDLDSRAWLPTLPTDRAPGPFDHAIAVEDRLILSGWDPTVNSWTGFRLDVATGSYKAFGANGAPACEPDAPLAVGSRLVVPCHGLPQPDHPEVFRVAINTYDFATDHWTAYSPLEECYADSSRVGLIDDVFYVVAQCANPTTAPVIYRLKL
jgi:hypothetical protein